MTLQDLQKKIEEIASAENINQQEIMNGIIASLEVKYQSKDYSSEDKQIIEEIKEKFYPNFIPSHKIKN